ncbi:MAG TPA: glycosyl hydrolase family 8 [Candidatus Paceibacterota bacterium]|jgi:Endoglucanase Y
MKKDTLIASVLAYGTFTVIIAVLVAVLFNVGGIRDVRPGQFSDRNMLQALWHQYKLEYLEPGTMRALDKSQDNITTSEGQSYTMLRAVWLDDKETFDTAWQWTKDNIQRKNDHLLSWLFGERPDGSYGVLVERGGENAATDADTDAALALIFAWRRWNDQSYFGDAILMIRDIWAKEVIMIAGKPYLLANNVEKTAPKQYVLINPSYFAPYAYKVFATVDQTHDWLGLAATSYEVAQAAIKAPLDKETSGGLPPDWIAIDKKTGELVMPQSGGDQNLTTNYSFDALRMSWRFALDWRWNQDERAKTVLSAMNLLSREWDEHGSLAASYAHDGTRISNMESLAMYGGSLGYFVVSDPRAARDIYRKKLEAVYDPNESKWNVGQGYYDDNWAWFGMALYTDGLQDLSLKANE